MGEKSEAEKGREGKKKRVNRQRRGAEGWRRVRMEGRQKGRKKDRKFF